MKWIIAVFVLGFFSCSKKVCDTCNKEQDYVNATILNSGPIETDGCGWVVRIGDDQYYHPDSLKEEFRQNELTVKICFSMTTEKFYCGIAATAMPVIHVLDIRK